MFYASCGADKEVYLILLLSMLLFIQPCVLFIFLARALSSVDFIIRNNLFLKELSFAPPYALVELFKVLTNMSEIYSIIFN